MTHQILTTTPPPPPSPQMFQTNHQTFKRKGRQPFYDIFIKILSGGFGKIWIRKFIYVIFYIFYHSLFPLLPLYDEGILPFTHRTHHCCFLERQFKEDNQRIGRFLLIQTT